MNTLDSWLNEKSLICPSDISLHSVSNLPGDQKLSYGISYVLSADRSAQTNAEKLWYNVKENKIVMPSSFIIASDISASYYFGNGTANAAVIGNLNGEISVVDGFCKHLSFRHDGINFRFPAALADGHVEQFFFYKMSDRCWDLRNKGGYGETM